jgi:hypothetical protein
MQAPLWPQPGLEVLPRPRSRRRSRAVWRLATSCASAPPQTPLAPVMSPKRQDCRQVLFIPIEHPDDRKRVASKISRRSF